MIQPSFTGQRDMFHEAAIANTGHSDFGDGSYRPGLDILLDSLDRRAGLPAAEAASAKAVIIGSLAGRLTAQAGWNRWPQVRSGSIVRPLVIIGIPRTGTTALHNLLSLDPQFQGFERWLVEAPIPRPPREEWESHPQYRRISDQVEARRRAAPRLFAAHSAEAWEIDECIVPMSPSFCCNWFGVRMDVPEYDAWFAAQDETPSFRRYADVLKLVGMNDDRRWLLKNPSHVFGIDSLLAVFPDACVVQTHRHPVQAMSSIIDLIGGLRDLSTGRPFDRDRVERREVAFWAEGARRSMAAQARHPERFVNVWQNELRVDPMKIVHDIYDHFGIALSPLAEERMLEWAERNKADGRPPRAYPTAENAGWIEEAFAQYIEHYDLEGDR